MKLFALSLIALSSITFHAWSDDIDDLSNKVDELSSQLEDTNSKLDDANSKLDNINNALEEAYYQSPQGQAEMHAWQENRNRIDDRHDREFTAKQTKLQAKASSSQGFTMTDMRRWREQWKKLGKMDLVSQADAWIADHICN